MYDGEISKRMTMTNLKMWVLQIISPFTRESHKGEDGCVYDSLRNDNFSITGNLSKRPGVLFPHKVQL